VFCGSGWGWSGHGFWGGWLWPALVIVLLVGIALWLTQRRGAGKAPPSLHCPGCRENISEAYLRCPHCGETLKRNCPSCSRIVNNAWVCCPFCSQDLHITSDKPAAG
jgi:predicted amidophosphoribosyltransferase